MNNKAGQKILGIVFIILCGIDIFRLVRYQCVGTPWGEFCGQEAIPGALIMIPLFLVFGFYFLLKKK